MPTEPHSLPLIVGFDYRHSIPPKLLTASLGGKGANLAEMATVLHLPVPQGFTLTTVACCRALESGSLDDISQAVDAAMLRLESQTGRKFGNPENPLLVSVRSGAPASMPGMMDTVLNVGVNPAVAAGLAMRSGSENFGWDCYARLAAMYASSVLGVQVDITGEAKRLLQAIPDPAKRIAAFDRYLVAHAPLPAEPRAQLLAAIGAVIQSWNSDRAITYRRIEKIADRPCTAVTIQSMVFGNLGATSGSGVAFTRDPANGAPMVVGDWLANAQGEDVVAGTHKTGTLDDLAALLPQAAAELHRMAYTLEHHLGDMCDIEFTVEESVLWLLQVRVGKRSAGAALRIAIDIAEDMSFQLDRRGAVERVKELLARPPCEAPSLRSLLPDAVLFQGVGVSPGIGVGRACFDSEAVLDSVAAGEPAILVRRETSPADIRGMAEAAGIVTVTGGKMSHAAVVARGWGVPAIVGMEGLVIASRAVSIGGKPLNAGDWMSIDGVNGEVALQKVEYVALPLPEVAVLKQWARDCGLTIGAAVPAGSEAVPGSVMRYDLTQAAPILLAIRGMTAMEELAQLLSVPPDAVATELQRLTDAGNGEMAKRGFRLTANGLAQVGILIDKQRELFALEKNPLDLLDDFDSINKNFKGTITDWQLRNGVTPNDHQDALYDAAILARLQEIHTAIADWLEGRRAVPLSRLFCDRLNRAMKFVTNGNTSWLLSPRVDSYHSVWFELHEYLIRFAGRDRAEEAASGRAM